MVSKAAPKSTSFAERFLLLKGGTTFREISDRLNRLGHKVTPQAAHKWSQGGGTTPENLLRLAKVLGVQASELLFGERQVIKYDQATPEAELIGWAWDSVPERFRGPLRRDIVTLAAA